MRRAGLIILVAFLGGAGAAIAQEVQFDSKALDTTGAGAAPAKRKAKKAAAAPDGAQQQPAQGAKPGANRQFGELEGWSPGKEPPKPKDKYDADQSTSTSSGGKPGVSVTPSGSMNVGLPF